MQLHICIGMVSYTFTVSTGPQTTAASIPNILNIYHISTKVLRILAIYLVAILKDSIDG